jgi:mono/diheme cytochrome c family protein
MPAGAEQIEPGFVALNGLKGRRRMTNLTRIILRCASACVLAAAIVAGCSKDRDNHDHPDLTTGEELFNYHCAECHGDDGTGKLVKGTPANILTRKDMRGIVDYITGDTGQGRKMPVFATMSGTEAAKIAAYLIELRDRYDDLPENKRKNRHLLIDPEHKQSSGK